MLLPAAEYCDTPALRSDRVIGLPFNHKPEHSKHCALYTFIREFGERECTHSLFVENVGSKLYRFMYISIYVIFCIYIYICITELVLIQHKLYRLVIKRVNLRYIIVGYLYYKFGDILNSQNCYLYSFIK